MTEIELSVVIPTRNRNDKVIDLLRSLGALPPGIELLIVDDASDRPVALQLAPAGTVRVERHDVALGVSASRNLGLCCAQGTFVVFLDDDDLPLEGWLQQALTSMRKEGIGAACWGARRRSHTGTIAVPQFPSSAEPLFNGFCVNVLAGTFVARRADLLAIGGFDETLRFSELTELWIRLSARLRAVGLGVEAINRELIEIRLRDPMSNRHRPEDVVEAVERIVSVHADHFQRDRRKFADFHAVGGTMAMRARMRTRALQHFFAAAGAEPLRPRRWAQLALVLLPYRTSDFLRNLRRSLGSGA